MRRARLWTSRIEAFDEWGRRRARISPKGAESYVRRVTTLTFPEATIPPLGSQSHPDLFIAHARAMISIERFAGRRKLTKGVLEKWEASRDNRDGIRFVRVEVKTTRGNLYVLNDTFPPPDSREDEVYALFHRPMRQVVVTTSSTMAAQCRTTPSITARYKQSSAAEEQFGRDLKRIWGGTPVRTAARPTYSVFPKYAHARGAIGAIIRLLRQAGLR